MHSPRMYFCRVSFHLSSGVLVVGPKMLLSGNNSTCALRKSAYSDIDISRMSLAVTCLDFSKATSFPCRRLACTVLQTF